MNVSIKVIPHNKHRYPTVGDWFHDMNSNLQIRVSEMSDARYELLVGIHELVETVLCDEAGVDEADVTAFDVAYEKHRKEGDTSEPGDSPLAPYYKQHQVATGIERILAAALNVDWTKYEKEINSL